ncbi:MAG: glucoamylase family protein [Aquabacterium sp.]|uniref:GH36-type glycosyl hydrolase domain-containing protein n=1 Tax=Aquabacterium sp. TaxID=1872578 RepID=UPI0027177064|nr:glucoamylase family protein [Aquabacterium sp.]MDO9004398.1 glucoamylase family protein [Aquabacterium sp.]
MARSPLLLLLPEASAEVCNILSPSRGPMAPANRSEIFGVSRFADHGRSLAATHRARNAALRSTAFFPRLRDNIRVLREAHHYISAQAITGHDVSPAAEWLLDNFHLIEAQLKEIRDGLPRRYFRDLPVLIDEPLAGLPRVYGVAWAFVAHNDSAFDEDLLTHFLRAYQEVRDLTLGELWALPTTLRVVLIENLRRLAENVATSKAAREVANLCCDRIETYSPHQLDALLALMNARGAGRAFLTQMAQRLQDSQIAGVGHERYHEWLNKTLPDLAAVQMQQPVERTANNLSVSNAISALRAIGDADWTDIVGQTSSLMQLMMSAPTFEAERDDTRSQTLHDIEDLARRSGQSELSVAHALLALMNRAQASPMPPEIADDVTVASHWLQGPGRPQLMSALGLQEHAAMAWRFAWRAGAVPAYLAALALGTAALVTWVVNHPGPQALDWPGAGWLMGLAVLLMIFPASEAVVAMVNRLISESVRPVRFPRLALSDGIPPEHRVMVVIPAMLTDAASVKALTHQLCLHYMANPERHAQFALLTDWADAEVASLPTDQALVQAVAHRLGELNERFPVEGDEAPRFIVLHRERRFSETEQTWMGWERKRGKLEQLIEALATGQSGAFLNLDAASRIAPQTNYVVTLDSDTQLPPGRLRDLVGVAAHPHNRPRLDARGTRVISGHGILQPRIVTPLPAPRDMTRFHWLFAGQLGIDPYSAASSEVYQDVFDEGSFTGKGLLNVQAVHAVLSGRLPEGRVLSHDLLEGSLVRCAGVTDITLIEDAPFHADVAASRLHRWIRGDWQLLSFLVRGGWFDIGGINRWKMIDNLRRSLVAPMSFALLILALGSGVISPWAVIALVLVAFVGGPLLGAVAGLAPSRDDIAMAHFYRQALADVVRSVGAGLWHLAQLLNGALMAADAIVRTLYRMLVSHRHLLEWTTAAAAQASTSHALAAIIWRHRNVTAVALIMGTLLFFTSPYPWLALGLCLLWAASPLWTWWVSRVSVAPVQDAVASADRFYLSGLARDTWRLFERCVGPQDHHLPPDNLQTLPYDMVAHRTSPTNIGLYLLSTACARQFGWIGTQDLLDRLEATLASMLAMQRHRGHFLNWYDTETLRPLLPSYVSTVDSGNLSGHLLATAQACLELSAAPLDDRAARLALQASAQRLQPMLPLLAELPGHLALMQLVALVDPLGSARQMPQGGQRLLNGAALELEALQLFSEARPEIQSLLWCLADHLSTLRSAWRDQAAQAQAHEAVARLESLARQFKRIAWEPDYSFLYHRKRHLFHIGYRIAEQQLDASFYDLLASESRLTSLLAIAKGDVPVNHWAALGRPTYAAGTHAGLRSWSGSMFEYLMPSLVLDEPHGSLLHSAGHAAVLEQMSYAHKQRTPWGMSESAYAASDHTLAYQYSPQGVPRLALRRTPLDELVIAPYATVLAAELLPRQAVSNLRRIESLLGRGRYGLIEALDFSPSRQTGVDRVSRVSTFMAHHQGMSIVSLANVLLDGAPRRWGMANAHIEAVASLLHERVPREISTLHTPPASTVTDGQQRDALGMLRDVTPGVAALEPTHLLSNGRYSVALRPNGAGWSRWGNAGITRWRDDVLRDACGSFMYLRWDQALTPVSLTQHPAPDPNAHYHSTYHAERVSFDAIWPELETRVTVWVSPEDDIEFRQVEIRNVSDRGIDLEFMSAFDVTLADPRADEAHPAFSNLFVRAEWVAAQQALMFERRPRLVTEKGLSAAHFLADGDAGLITEVRIQTDRLRWLGRNHDVSSPQGLFDAPPELDPSRPPGEAAVLNTGLDPVACLSVRLHIPAQSKACLTMCTAASDNVATLRSVMDKYRQRAHIERASLMSATLAGIKLRDLRLNAETFAAIQTLTTALAMVVTRPINVSEEGPANACDRKLLWRFGISGDRPIVLVSAGVPQGLGLVRSLAQALRLWTWGAVVCDLVIVNAEPTSYLMALQRDIGTLRERYVSDIAGNPGPSAASGFYVLRSNELSVEDLRTLHVLARLHLNADGRPLAHHITEWCERHEQALEERSHSPQVTVLASTPSGVAPSPPNGTFDEASGEFRFEVTPRQRPTRPWINVLSNPAFGAQISEAGGCYTWAVNSRLNQVTPWSNDPVGDPSGEWLLLQDERTREVWNVTPAGLGGAPANYRVRHEQGITTISHRQGDLDVQVSWCVDPKQSIKQLRLKLLNQGSKTLNLRAIKLVEWIMGANRTDRHSVRTSTLTQTLPDPRGIGGARRITALMATQREHSAGFGGGTAFLAMVSELDDAGLSDDWTCDRRECFDARGRLVVPDYFGQKRGVGLDPCAALSVRLSVEPGTELEQVFLLGHANSLDEARHLAVTSAFVSPSLRLQQVREDWNERLGATTVKTPDPLFDAMVNRWLLYQTVTCRLWSKAGFYQAGGAFGFRDQLQDSLALAGSAPDMLRQQILLGASRQFPEGDVQHWWHAPTGAGVRTHFSDDLLWLAYASVHYLNTTGDASLLSEEVPFLEGAPIPEGAEDAYYTPSTSPQTASLYEHCARAIDRSLKVGVHGLPLMGVGDWNDGMNRVGSEGRGESVWLAWFLCRIVADFAPIAKGQGETARARRWEEALSGWKSALQEHGWDGQWYRRAFFDDGQALGASANAECRIDLIAQAWAVLSRASTPANERMAMSAVETHLVDAQAGLIKLLDPPLANAEPSAGYIQAYPPGVRENGGQYSHAGVWALMAQAQRGDGDAAYRYFTYLSPAHRTAHPTRGPAYGIEPYVMAGDVYTQPPYVGRGGWSWYTGAAAWLHRAAIESIFGLQQRDGSLTFKPCLPSHWQHADMTVRRGGHTLHFKLCRPAATVEMAKASGQGAKVLQPGEAVRWDGLGPETWFLIPLPD